MAAEISKPDYTYLWSSGGSIVAPSNVKVQTGWTAEVPPFQWENWSQNRQDQAIAHILQKGVSVWSAAGEYWFTTNGERSYVQGSDGQIYVALQDSVNQDPTTATAYWKLAFPTTGRLLRTSVYRNSAGVLQVSVDGGAFVTASSTFTPLTTTTSIYVKAHGGGGAGGGVGGGTNPAGQVATAPGGASGAYLEGIYTTGFSGAAITVGAGGVGVAAAAGGNGASTSLGALCVAPGGPGGGAAAAQVPPNLIGNNVGSATATGGNVFNGAGAAGGYGSSYNATGYTSGAGAASVFGAGGRPIGSGNNTGINGIGFGSGGSGASSGSGSNLNLAGGGGVAGLLIIQEY